MIRFIIKIAITVAIIISASQIGKRFPSLGGLIAAMPLTTLLVLLWIYTDNADYQVMAQFTRGVLWGIIPTFLFFLTAVFGFRHQFAFPAILGSSLAVWLVAALVHQYLLGSH